MEKLLPARLRGARKLPHAVIALVLALAVAAPVHATSGADPTGAPGLGASTPSIAYDPSGHLHVVYIERGGSAPGLYYSTNATGAWLGTKIAPLSASGNEEWTSLAVDSLGKAHVVYQKPGAGIYYLTNRSGGWTKKRIRASSSFIVYPEIEVDALRKAHIVYFVPSPSSSGISYSTNAGGRWKSTRITTSAFDLRADVAVDSSRKPHVIVGRSDSGFRYLTNRSGRWKSVNILAGMDGSVRALSIDIDPSGRPVVAYTSQWSPGQPGGTFVAVRSGAAWDVTTLSDYETKSIQVRVAPDASLHVGAFGSRHYSNESGFWQDESVADDVSSDVKEAFAIGSGGELAFAYPRSDGSIGVSTRAPWSAPSP